MRSSISRFGTRQWHGKNEPSGVQFRRDTGIMNLPRARAIFCGRGVIIMVLLLKILPWIQSSVSKLCCLCSGANRPRLTRDSPISPEHCHSTASFAQSHYRFLSASGSVVAFSSSFNDDAQGAQTGSGGTQTRVTKWRREVQGSPNRQNVTQREQKRAISRKKNTVCVT
jgi:hypothetical protein